MSSKASPSILHLIDTGGPGGAETVFAELAARLDGAPLRSVAIVPRDAWLAAHLRERGIEPLIVPSAGAMSLSYLQRLASVVRSANVQLIHAHLLGSAVYAGLLGAVFRLPTVAVFHGPSDFKGPQRLLAVKRWLLRRKGSVIVSVSGSTIAALREFGIEPERIELIRNGVDTERFFPDRSGALREELGVGHDEHLVGAVGNVRGPKDYETLVHAARAVLSELPAAHFAVVGDGAAPEVQRLTALRDSLGIRERFHFLGFRRAERQLLSDFDLFVSSSSSEGLPLSFLEAMACGLCVVATERGGAQEVVDDQTTGLLAPIKNPPALAAAILRALQDAELRKRLAAAGRQRVIQEFSLDTTIEAYRSLYARLLGSGQAGERR